METRLLKLGMLNRIESEDEFLRLATNFPKMPCAEIMLQSYLKPMWLSAREAYIRWFWYSIPCLEAVDALRRHFAGSRVVDAGAGTGYWSSIMRRFVPGITVVPCDNRNGKFNRKFAKGTTSSFGFRAVRVKKIDALRMITSSKNVFMSWPVYDCDFGYRVARRISQGRLLILISEGRGGCCGNDKLFDYLETAYVKIDEVTIPTFEGIHDCMDVFRKKSRVPE